MPDFKIRGKLPNKGECQARVKREGGNEGSQDEAGNEVRASRVLRHLNSISIELSMFS